MNKKRRRKYHTQETYPDQRHILIVEDDESLRHLIQKTLSREGYQTEITANGRTAFEYLKERPETVLLLDHKLPDMDSLQLIQQLKEKGIDTLFILMTGQGDERLAVQMMKMGAYDYLVKGIDFLHQLQSTFQRLFRELETKERLEKAEEAASLAEERLHTQYNLSISLSKSHTLEETLQVSLEAALKGTDLDCGGIYLFDEEKNNYYLAVHQGFSPRFVEVIAIYDPNMASKEYLSPYPLYTDYEESTHRLYPLRCSENLKAVAMVPILFEGEMIASFKMASHTLHEVPIDDRISLEAIAAQIGNYIAQMRAEENLKKREKKYRAIFESIHDAIMIMDEKGTFIECNEKAVQLFGLEQKEEILHRHPTDFSPPTQPDGKTSLEASSYYIEKALKTQENVFFQWVHRSKDGTAFTAEVILSAYPAGDTMVIQSTVRDITPHLKAKEAVKETEEQLHMVLENFPDGIIVLHERDYSYQFAGGKGLSELGLSTESLIGKRPRDLFPLDFCEELEEHIDKAFEGFQSTFELQWKDHFFMETVLPFYQDGEILSVMGVINNITQHKKAQEEIRQSERRFRLIVESSPLPLSINDSSGRYEYLNPKFMELFGYTLDDIPTREKWFKLAYPDPEYRAHVLGVYRGDLDNNHEKDDTPRHFHVTCKDGRTIEILFRLVSMDNDKQLIIYEDITERLMAEKVIKERNKELSTLYNLSIHMRTAKNSAQLLPMVLEKTLSLLPSHAGMIILHSPQENNFHVQVAMGDWRENAHSHLPMDSGVQSIVFKTHQPYVTRDFDSEVSPLPFKQMRPVGPCAFVPLLSEEGLLGLLVIGRCKELDVAPYSPTEITLLTAIGEMAGNALRRQQLFDSEQERMNQLKSLRKIDMAITNNQDLSPTLKISLQQIITMLQVDGTAILRLNKDRTLHYLAWDGFEKYNPTETLNRVEPALPFNFLKHRNLEQGPFLISDCTRAPLEYRESVLMKEEGFVAYGAIPLVARNRIHGILEVFHRRPLYPHQDWLKFMETLAGQVAIAIDNHNLYTSLEYANMELSLAYDATIEGWAYALDLRDKETEGHSQRVTELTVKLAIAMGIPMDQILHIRRGAILHDIGKMGIPDSILLKPGKLTEEEWKIMRLHPQYAREMLYPIEYLRPALTIPYCHHEKWDGSGYPRGLKGEEIPLEARIFAVVDVFDALTSDRPYRSAWPREKALELIDRERNRHFDAEIADLFLKEKKKEQGFKHVR